MELTNLIHALIRILPANGRADSTLKKCQHVSEPLIEDKMKLTDLVDTFVQARKADGRAARKLTRLPACVGSLR